MRVNSLEWATLMDNTTFYYHKYLPVVGIHFLVILYSNMIMYSLSGQIIEPCAYVTQICLLSVQPLINRYACAQLHSIKVKSFVSQCSYNSIKTGYLLIKIFFFLML